MGQAVSLAARVSLASQGKKNTHTEGIQGTRAFIVPLRPARPEEAAHQHLHPVPGLLVHHRRLPAPQPRRVERRPRRDVRDEKQTAQDGPSAAALGMPAKSRSPPPPAARRLLPLSAAGAGGGAGRPGAARGGGAALPDVRAPPQRGRRLTPPSAGRAGLRAAGSGQRQQLLVGGTPAPSLLSTARLRSAASRRLRHVGGRAQEAVP